jgi:hypothetical protein
MKKKYLYVVAAFLFSAAGIQAQVAENPAPPQQARRLSEEQLALFKANREKQIEFRKEFRASLSEQQLNMLRNPQLSREMKMRNLRSSLSERQTQILRNSIKNSRIQRSEIMNTMSYQQRLMLRRAYMYRSMKGDNFYFRQRLYRRLHRI